ncbi:MAG: gamma-glutamylcyclotransferase [Elainellaceae cyanobacterium]
MAASIEPTYVFVYGTLKPGEANYARYCAGRVASQQPAIAPGYLYALPVGYPAMIARDQGEEILDRQSQSFTAEGREAVVWGYRLQLKRPDDLALLDELEDYLPQRSPEQNEYYRCAVSLLTPSRQPLGAAWAYLMEPWRVRQVGGYRIAQGQWTGHSAARFFEL